MRELRSKSRNDEQWCSWQAGFKIGTNMLRYVANKCNATRRLDAFGDDILVQIFVLVCVPFGDHHNQQTSWCTQRLY